MAIDKSRDGSLSKSEFSSAPTMSGSAPIRAAMSSNDKPTLSRPRHNASPAWIEIAHPGGCAPRAAWDSVTNICLPAG